MSRDFSPDDARRYYDCHVALQDRQGWYEDAALAALTAAGDFGTAATVVELGCGTGRFAELLLARHLNEDARYVGLDISGAMLDRAAQRLAPFAGRVQLVQADGTRGLPVRTGGADRFVATYVMDLLPGDAADVVMAEAHRILPAGGLLSAASLTRASRGLRAGLVARLWAAIHRLAPGSVGGCRPVRLAPLLRPADWDPVHHDVVTSFSVPSEVLVARRR